MVVKIYGVAKFAFTQIVLVVLIEKNVPYELITIDWAGKEHKTPAYLENTHLDNSRTWTTTDLSFTRPRPSIEVSNFSPLAGGIVKEVLGKPLSGAQPDQQVVDAYVANLEEKLDGYEAILKKRRFLAGDIVTAADLSHLPFGTLIGNIGIKVLENPVKRPNVARWWNDISSRPAWKKVLAIADA
ncbi:glutathione S-transferase [Irpex lacteus]|nr:glutathione S-transferase [Irpex lacteus]